MEDDLETFMLAQLRDARVDTLEVTLLLCRIIAKTGGDACCCVEAIQSLKDTFQRAEIIVDWGKEDGKRQDQQT